MDTAADAQQFGCWALKNGFLHSRFHLNHHGFMCFKRYLNEVFDFSLLLWRGTHTLLHITTTLKNMAQTPKCAKMLNFMGHIATVEAFLAVYVVETILRSVVPGILISMGLFDRHTAAVQIVATNPS